MSHEIVQPELSGSSQHIFPGPTVVGLREAQPRSAYYELAATTDRTYNDYANAFGFDVAAEFPGETLLDLGAGAHATFCAEATEKGMKPVAVNPNWENNVFRHHFSPSEAAGPAIAALGQELPFKDNTFGVVLSLWGVPTYLPGTAKDYGDTFFEIQRVLKPDGLAILTPIMNAIRYQRADFESVLQTRIGDSYEILERDHWKATLLIAKNAGVLASSKAMELKSLING